MLKWNPIKLKLADLKTFDRNPRTITPEKFESLKKSLVEPPRPERTGFPSEKKDEK